MSITIQSATTKQTAA